MDPVTLIVTALALGAAAGLKDTATQIVKDSYAGLKAIIIGRWPSVAPSVKQLEDKPDSENRRGTVKEDLTDLDVERDAEIIQRAKAVVDAVEAHNPTAANSIGVDLGSVKGEFLRLVDIQATCGGIGVRAKDIDVKGGVEIKKIRAEGTDGPKG